MSNPHGNIALVCTVVAGISASLGLWGIALASALFVIFAIGDELIGTLKRVKDKNCG